jgi:hypothetical protein
MYSFFTLYAQQQPKTLQNNYICIVVTKQKPVKV